MSIEVTSVRRVYPFAKGDSVVVINANNRVIHATLEDILYGFAELDGTSQDRVTVHYVGNSGSQYTMCIPACRVGVSR